MNKRVAVLILSLAVNGLAQVEKKPVEVEKSFEPKYLQGDRGNRAIDFVSKIMIDRAKIHWDPVLHLVVIVGSADHVAHAEQLLRKFDVPEVRKPAKTFEFTIYLVGAYIDPAGRMRGGPMPADLDSVVKEMRGSFGYKDFSLLDAIPVSARTSSPMTEYDGILPVTAMGAGRKYFYRISIESPFLLEDGKTVMTPGFRFMMDIPSYSSEAKAGESGIKSDLTVREGQKVVLGKIRLDDGDNAVFLVVTVKVL
jgi:hypothetical protein